MTGTINNIFTIEEEGFCLHLIEAIEKQRVQSRLLSIIDSLTENTADIKTVLFKLKKYSKSLGGEGFNFSEITASIQKNKETFILIVFEIYNISLKLKFEDAFLRIIHHFLSNRNLGASITLLSDYNKCLDQEPAKVH
jgi:hypothetical protein